MPTTQPRLMNYTVNVHRWLSKDIYEVVCAQHLPETVYLHIYDVRNYHLVVNDVTVAASAHADGSSLAVTVIGSPDGHHLHGIFCEVCEMNVANGYDIDGKVILD